MWGCVEGGVEDEVAENVQSLQERIWSTYHCVCTTVYVIITPDS